MGRRRKDDRAEMVTEGLVAWVTPELARVARELADAEGRTISSLLRRLLEQRLTRRKRECPSETEADWRPFSGAVLDAGDDHHQHARSPLARVAHRRRCCHVAARRTQHRL
jgi:hypothetical protein